MNLQIKANGEDRTYVGHGAIAIEYTEERCFYDRRYWFVTARFLDIWFRPITKQHVVDDFGNLVSVETCQPVEASD